MRIRFVRDPLAWILLVVSVQRAAAQCTSQLDLGPGEDVAIPAVGAIFSIVAPPDGFVVGARAEVAIDAPIGESADNWSIALVGFDLITDSGAGGAWAFSGSDLGWAGPGQFTGVLTTNSLNGAIHASGPFSYWEAQVQPVDAFFTGAMRLDIHIILDATATFPGDLDNDQFVGLADLTTLLSSFGLNSGGDVDCDGDTDLNDLTMLLSRFGTCAPLIC